jgi:hypothetical protein
MNHWTTTSSRLALVALSLVSGAAAAGQPPGPAAEAPADATPDDGDAFVSGFFRFDYDAYGLQLWAGATHAIGSLQLFSDVYVTDSYGEVDLGPQIQAGNFTFITTVGAIYDFSTQSVIGAVAPLVTTIYDSPAVYFESWLQMTFGSAFTDEAEDLFHSRNFLLYKVNPTLWLGPQVEVNYGVTQAEEMTSLPVGGQLSIGYGKENRLSLFLGYDTVEQMDPATGEPMDSDRLAGRFTFVRLW